MPHGASTANSAASPYVSSQALSQEPRKEPPMSTSGLIVLAVIIVFVLWIVMIYNGLVSLRQRVGQSFADIDVQLRQRHDLIPNLVETVKGYATHERGTLEAVI